MGAGNRGRSVRRVADPVSSHRKAGPEPMSSPGQAGRRGAARPGRHRAERGRRLRSVPTERTLPDAAPAAAPFVGVGSVLGERYRLERILGDGGSATVFGGTDTLLRRQVAIKVFHTNSDGTTQARREREIHLASGFVHPNLVAVYDAHLDSQADEGGGPLSYLVCEYVDGPSLARRLDGGPLPAAQAAGIGIGVAQALAVLHIAGVVHRDVKPGNVLLENGTDRAKLSDFGIARDLGTDPVTRTSDVIGTAPYLSPEQARGETVGCPSDIYSLGLVLLECLTGRREYDGEPIPAAAARLIRDPRVPADLPAPWPTLLRRMTGPKPDQRPTADEVAVILAHRSPAADAETAPPTTSGRRVPAAPASTTAHTRRRGWLLAAAALLITAGVAGGVASRDPLADPPAASTPTSTQQSAPPSQPAQFGTAPATPPFLTASVTAPPPSTAAPATQAQPVANPDIPQVTAAAEPAPASAAGNGPNPGDEPAQPPNPASPEADPAIPVPVADEPAPTAAEDSDAPAMDSSQNADVGSTAHGATTADAQGTAPANPNSNGNGNNGQSNGNGNGNNGHGNGNGKKGPGNGRDLP